MVSRRWPGAPRAVARVHRYRRLAAPQLSPQLSRLVFRARLPALGTASFSLRRAAADDSGAGRVAVSTVLVGERGRGFEIGSGRLAVKLSPAGLLDSAQAGGAELPLRQDLMLYWGNGGRSAPASNPDGSGGDGGSESDAYVFSPQVALTPGKWHWWWH